MALQAARQQTDADDADTTRASSILSLDGRPIDHDGASFGQLGPLQVRQACTAVEIEAAQRLRYQVFYEEQSARPSVENVRRRLDFDRFDSVCDHLLVIDQSGQAPGDGTEVAHGTVVGTYRILRQDVVDTLGIRFYSENEFHIRQLVDAKPDHRFMEVGRSCVAASHRNKRTVEALWHGLWTYARRHRIDVMVGCASFPGTDPDKHGVALSFLAQHRSAPEAWRCPALRERSVRMDRVHLAADEAKLALRSLPPLIKGYLKLGAFFGDGAVIDHQFSTVDVLVILPVAYIDQRYFAHFGAPDETASRLERGITTTRN